MWVAVVMSSNVMLMAEELSCHNNCPQFCNNFAQQMYYCKNLDQCTSRRPKKIETPEVVVTSVELQINFHGTPEVLQMY